MKLLKTVRKWTGKGISVLTLTVFAGVIFSSVGSALYMNHCIQRESEARQTRTDLAELGQTLADASDYLTEEVRLYAVTGDIEHFYNYWNEIYVKKQRENVIHTLEQYTLPDNESRLLSEAKQYSDYLVDTEAESMKLMLLADGLDEADFDGDAEMKGYVSRVMNSPDQADYAGMTVQELRDKALEILYDAEYLQVKEQIMTPIESFQSVTAERLETEVVQATEGRRKGGAVQIGCAVVSLLLIGILLWALNLLYIRPAIRYAFQIQNAGEDLTKIRIAPDGAEEPYQLGRTFNRLLGRLFRELESKRIAEEQMRAARNEADQANHAKSEFLAHMSHELRTPLGCVTGYIYLLEQSELDGEQKRYCRSIRSSSEALLGLINDILDFSKIEAGEICFEEIDFELLPLIGDIQRILENNAREKGLYFHVICQGDLPFLVHGDPVKLRQVLMNLIGNAIKFTETGGVTLCVRAEETDQAGTWVDFSVSDTGIGIRSEDQERIFEPFVQGDEGISRRFGGSGLGLVIASRTVEAATGGREHLTVESEPGVGSTFRFRMQFQTAQNTGQASTEPAAKGMGTDYTVLIVDDNETNLAVESEILHSFGLRTASAQSGAEALRMMDGQGYDMVLLDIRLPDMDGYEIARRLRQNANYRLVPVIALTADAVSGVRERAKQAGMNDCVIKPVKPAELYRLMCHYFELAEEMPQALATDESRLFRRDEACSVLGGDVQKLRRLCENFILEHGRTAEYVCTHLKEGSYDNVRFLLHDLVGVSGNLCCDRLCAAGRRLLGEVHEGQSGSLETFLDLFNRTLEELKTFVAESRPEMTKNKRNSYHKLLHTLIELCEDYQVEAAEWMSTYREELREGMPYPAFQSLDRAVMHFDFAQALEILKGLEE